MRILAIVALAIIAFGVVGYAFATHGDMANVLLRAAFRLGLAHQGIEGNATIWYWSTVPRPQATLELASTSRPPTEGRCSIRSTGTSARVACTPQPSISNYTRDDTP